MVMKIKVREFEQGLYTDARNGKNEVVSFTNFPKGDWIDLRAADDYYFKAPQAGVQHQDNNEKVRDVTFDGKLIHLGIAMELPEGMTAIIRQRSSSTKKMGILMATSGVIDNSYKGNLDEWMMYVLPVKKAKISKGDRVCQFTLMPSQYATVWQKLKWLFTTKIEFEWVKELSDNNRGGHGSTGVN